MIIEFTAAPGSGKTYLSEQLKYYLQQDLELKNYKIYTRDDLGLENRKFKNKILNRLHNIIQTLQIIVGWDVLKICIEVLLSKRKITDKQYLIQYILYNIKNYYIISKFEKKITNSIFILDEGLLHVAGVYLDDDINKKKLEQYMRYIKRIKKSMYMKQKRIYVLVDSCITESFKRIDDRSQGWPKMWKKLTDEEKYFVLDKAFKKTALYLEIINDEKWDMVYIDNKFFKESYNEEFSKIKKLIQEYM